ncbi:MAG TPA: flagellar biosynthetic protein FliR [Solirubrobacteraceae bacterium]|nr:flagellar biosynthetic protein FliR [Solirubrobacteraceae bacterium]
MTQSILTGVLNQIGPGHIFGFFLVLARISPLFVLAPLFSSQMLPTQARTIMAVALSIGMTPIAMHGQAVPSDPLIIALLFVTNALTGLGFALAVSAVIAAVSSAGALLDVVAGFSYGQLINPMDGAAGGTLTNLYSLVGLALFIAIGGDAYMLRGIEHTFVLVPLTGAPQIGSLAAGIVNAASTIFISALELAAPALLALLITDIAFGMVSRVMPQLNIFAVGFPLKIGVALLVVAAGLPFMGGFLSNQVVTAVTSALQTV